mmetsp:Transcript_49301/g.96704  ORF Transcript_49301/g.96704 Transcript_49301/m.96704 type:complete len:198 (+) Transcript_49301:285-878(+)
MGDSNSLTASYVDVSSSSILSCTANAKEKASALARQASEDYASGRLAEAIEGFTQAIEAQPSFKYYTNRAVIYLQQKEYQKAHTDAVVSVNLNPSFKAYYAMGRSAMGMKQYSQAISAFTKCATFQGDTPMHKHARKNLNVCRKKMAKDSKKKALDEPNRPSSNPETSEIGESALLVDLGASFGTESFTHVGHPETR